jgi:hypothetical protein
MTSRETDHDYGYGSQTDAEREANDQAVREATALIAAMYALELDRPRLPLQLRRMQEKAARLARWLTTDDAKRGA